MTTPAAENIEWNLIQVILDRWEAQKLETQAIRVRKEALEKRMTDETNK